MPHNSVTGIDIIKKYIQYAKKITHSDFHCCDLSNFNLKRAFDVVVCPHTLEHFLKTDREKAIFNLYQHVKKNGLLIITVPSQFFMIFIEPVFKFIRKLINPSIEFDDEDIHERLNLKNELKVIKKPYSVLHYNTNCYYTTTYIVVKKL